MKNYSDQHCCINLSEELLDEGSLLKYYSRFREYGMRISKTTGSAGIDYCLFCGTKFPVSVRRNWFDILENEYGLESPNEEDRKYVPKEFLTDEWWKRRKL